MHPLKATKANQSAQPVSDDLPDTAVKIYANNWVATVIASPEADENGFFNVYATTIGNTLTDATTAAMFVLNAFAFGRTAFIRAVPEAHSETSFDGKITQHRGFVRFCYKLELGTWRYPDPAVKIPLIGEAS
jgi:hypothetical protein